MKVALLAGTFSVVVALLVAQTAGAPTDPSAGESRALASPTVPTTTAISIDADTGSGSTRIGRTTTSSTLRIIAGEAPSRGERAVYPARMVVPSLGLDVDIVSVGVDAQGLLDVPTPDQVGWYRFGASPGQEGAAVLAAHVDFDGRAGPFFALQEMEAGALIQVEFIDGSSQSFEVVDQALYDKTALPADELFRRTGSPVLHLATCGGSFDPVARRYLGNRVVTAVPVEEAVPVEAVAPLETAG